MVRELTDTKERVISEHLDKMVEAHTKMMKLVDEAMRNAQLSGAGNLNIFHQLKAALSFDRAKLLNIKPEDMLEYSKSWFETTQKNFSMIMEISKDEYSSLLKQIDEQFEIAMQQISQVDEQLSNINNADKRTWLQRKKDELVEREWD